MNAKAMFDIIKAGDLDARFALLYGRPSVPSARGRFERALLGFARLYGAEREVALFSVPGRSELSGNHTDHNRGCVIAASIDLDIIAVVAPRDDGVIHLSSEGYPESVVDLSEFTEPRPERFGSSDALIAGVCAGMREQGLAVGGFDAYTASDILGGSGLSSSAAFEVMIGNIENHLYNNGRIDNTVLAKIAQYAENRFFGKPCGLMDQMACALGGIISIDFADPAAPLVEQINRDLSTAGFALCIVNTGGNHADLTPDYAAVPAEMKALAAAMGKEVLREVDEAEFRASIATLRESVGDRAILRALHFFAENDRVRGQKQALLKGDLAAFLSLVQASGRSSFCYLQNVYSPANPGEQGISLALALAEDFLAPRGGVCRVHGGGFAGTIQALVPHAHVDAFCDLMDATFGAGACMSLSIRPEGAVRID